MSMSPPPKEILYSSAYLCLYYYEPAWIHADWQGFIQVEQVKEGCELLLKKMEEKNCYRVLNDNRKVRGTWTQAIRWLEESFFPRLVDKTPLKVAFLYSPYKSARYSVDRVLEVNDQYLAQSFEDFQEASQWLIGLPWEAIDEKPSILLKTLDNYTKIYLEEIYYISAQKGQTLVQTTDCQHITRKTLSYFSEMLPAPQFYRIHKSHLVNTRKIKALKYHAGGYYHLYLLDFGNVYLTVGRKYVKDLKLHLAV